jgi:hypothetical protein
MCVCARARVCVLTELKITNKWRAHTYTHTHTHTHRHIDTHTQTHTHTHIHTHTFFLTIAKTHPMKTIPKPFMFVDECDQSGRSKINEDEV